MSDPRAYLTSLEQFGVKLGLDQIRRLLDQLGHPERAWRAVHVGGTNGKGSVAAIVERALRAAGRRTGRYTSPHLVHLEERFAVDGRPVSPAALDRALDRVRRAAEGLPHPPSFFEATTAAAFELFRDAGVDVAVLEVGLGGRLDATNVVEPLAIAITAIDLDHQRVLGDDVAAIAAEKAGIVRSACPVVLAANPPAVREVIAAACQAAGARLTFAPDGATMHVTMRAGHAHLRVATPARSYDEVALSLAGRHQADNALVAIRLLEALGVEAAAVRTGLERAVWPGRLEPARWRGHALLLDGAHNPAGARALAAHVDETYGRRLPLVASVLGDKAVEPMLAALAPAASAFIFTTPGVRRAAAPAALVEAAARIAPSVTAEAAPTPEAALARAIALGAPVVVAGSLYLVGAVRALVDEHDDPTDRPVANR